MPQTEAVTKLQPRNVHVFGATSFLNDTATEMAYWVLPAFLGTIGAGAATLGIIERHSRERCIFRKALLRILFRPRTSAQATCRQRIRCRKCREAAARA